MQALESLWRMQALEKSVEAGGALDQYEIEGPDRAELLQDLAEFQLAAVSALLLLQVATSQTCCKALSQRNECFSC